MEHEYKIELSKRRIELAHERMNTAGILLDAGDYKSVANRLYYAIFSAMRAVLALDGFDSKKHSGIIARFRQSYIKTGTFSTEMSKIIDDLEVIREDSDYDDFYIISKEDVMLQYQRAEFFVSEVERYLQVQYSQT
ncbi:HEPN domain-containing protein [Ruminococcus difficilis]|uniref:HEPN domain-containing protein n=1 Tax=Ruminococcus difficilis TaxID=2763069 RepID=A0A934U4A4_9FIRM|nr:HEPN domain-containing protein [Ruminococcus difficilis]MBK6088344.1 HEPN domain-containing protein [Ruminococcus difficilis]